MKAAQVLASAGILGIAGGGALAALTPVELRPTADPAWRTRAMVLREETSALYNWSMPQELSPRVGFGNPALHDDYARNVWQAEPPVAVIAPQPPAYAEPEPVTMTGNEQTVADLAELGEALPAPEPAPQETPSAEVPAAP
jgi:hypothetical protein